MAISSNPVTGGTTNVVTVFKDETGGMYVDIQFTADVGTGPDPLPAGVHVVRVPVTALIS